METDEHVRARDWLTVHAERADNGGWRFPSGYTHPESESLAIVRAHQALGLEPTDIVSSTFLETIVDKIVDLERKVDALDRRSGHG